MHASSFFFVFQTALRPCGFPNLSGNSAIYVLTSFIRSYLIFPPLPLAIGLAVLGIVHSQEGAWVLMLCSGPDFTHNF